MNTTDIDNAIEHLEWMIKLHLAGAGLAKIMQEDADVFALAIQALKQVKESEEK